MVFASCCGPFDDQSPDLLKTWAIIAVVCGLLLLVDAAVLAWIRWREGERFWRQRAVRVALVATTATLVLAQRAWNVYLTARSMPVTSDITYNALGWIVPLSGIAILLTLLLLMLSLVELTIHFNERQSPAR